MRLLIYSHFFAPSIGGVESFAMSLARGLSRKEIASPEGQLDVTLVTQIPETPEHPSALPFEVVRRPNFFRLWEIIGQADAVIVVGPALMPMTLAVFRHKRLFVGHHGYQAICPNGLLFHHPTQKSCVGHFHARNYSECLRCNAANDKWSKSLAMLLLTFPRRVLCRLASFNVPVSNHVARRIALPRSRVVPNGVVDPSSLVNSPQLQVPQRNSNSFAYVGRLVVEKGVHILIEAAGLLKKRRRGFHIAIIGDGPERMRLETLAGDLDVMEEVRFCGFRRSSDLGELLREVSAIVMPSICEDVAPLTPIEQMMHERLIIASDIGGLAEEVSDTGLKFPPADAKALADHMELVLDRPDLVRDFGARARARALAKYTLDRMLAGYRALLNP